MKESTFKQELYSCKYDVINFNTLNIKFIRFVLGQWKCWQALLAQLGVVKKTWILLKILQDQDFSIVSLHFELCLVLQYFFDYKWLIGYNESSVLSL